MTTSRRITPEWLAYVRAYVEPRGSGKHTQLAHKAGISSPGLTQILSGTQGRSEHVEAISRITGAPLPPEAGLSSEEVRVLEKYRSASPDERAKIDQILDVIVSTEQKK